MAAAFPPDTNAGIAAAKKGAIPPRCRPTPGLRFLEVPYRRFFVVNDLLSNETFIYVFINGVDLRPAFSFG